MANLDTEAGAPRRPGPVRKLLIANRGEIAVRIARTAREMGLLTVAVYSEPDREAAHVRGCDEAVALGGVEASTSYLCAERLLEAAAIAGADAVHPGYGFLAESAEFARAVVEHGLTWVGPRPDTIAAMGDKLEAKRIVAAAGVPLAEGRELTVGTDPRGAAAEIGYPLLVKAASGGGGKGMRLVTHEREIGDAVDACRREAAAAFGDDRLFLERFLPAPRHVEVQILGDHHGNLVHLMERECSVQRRHQKVIEECPAPGIDLDTREALYEAALRAAKAMGYQSLGTVEFVVGSDGIFSFLEVNTRLQVEHPVTELVTGLDLVRLQLRVAEGRPLSLTQDDVVGRGHAIEARLYAESPFQGYLPVAGRIEHFVPGEASGVRWDRGFEAPSTVSPHYDPMLAKVIAHAPTRTDAARKLERALTETHLHGIVTNRDLLVAVLKDEAYLKGPVTTQYLERRFPDDESRRFPPPQRCVRDAAILVTLLSRAVVTPLATLPSGWRNNPSQPQDIELGLEGESMRCAYEQERDGTWTVWVDGTGSRVRAPGDVHSGSSVSVYGMEIDGRRVQAKVSVAGPERARSWEVTLPEGHVSLTESSRFSGVTQQDVAGATRSPMPGTVRAVHIEEGDEVNQGDLLCIIEAMKMEHRVVAPEGGMVTRVYVVLGQQVDADEVLVVVDSE